jgi:16S rRNA (adenine1518-N6/adenine1519-N6)-dimethyltransferase
MSLYSEARRTLDEAGLRPRRRLGQHFLVHEGVLASLLELLDLQDEDEVLEIGPGLGFLTRGLVERAGRVWAVELDPFLSARLRDGPLGHHPSLRLIEGDILEVPLPALLPVRRVKVAANLPYNISTPVLFRLFDLRDRFSFLVLMVQREVAERLAAAPGGKSYGALSVWCQIHGEIVGRLPVPASAFFPRPKVRSMALKIKVRETPLLSAKDTLQMKRLLRAAFGQRRKTLGNALTEAVGGKAKARAFLESQGVDPERRAETLGVEHFIRLARSLPVQA